MTPSKIDSRPFHVTPIYKGLKWIVGPSMSDMILNKGSLII